MTLMGLEAFYFYFGWDSMFVTWHLVCHTFWSATKMPTDKSDRTSVNILYYIIYNNYSRNILLSLFCEKYFWGF